MRGTWELVVACAVVGVLLTAGGCSSGGEDGAAANTAAINGTSGTAAAGAGGSVETPPSGGPIGTLPPGQSPVPVRPVVLIETSMGDITVELDSEKAPATVGNFLDYVESGFYDQTIFHQVFKDAVILGGMFTSDLTQKPAGPPVTNEAHNGLKNVRGTIAMARDYNVIDSATCQFFINVKDNPNYDHKPGARESYANAEDYGYCVFGRVTEDSMPVVDRIAEVEVHDTADFERLPVQTVLIKSIRKIR